MDATRHEIPILATFKLFRWGRNWVDSSSAIRRLLTLVQSRRGYPWFQLRLTPGDVGPPVLGQRIS
jgi:hypothetical protein